MARQLIYQFHTVVEEKHLCPWAESVQDSTWYADRIVCPCGAPVLTPDQRDALSPPAERTVFDKITCEDCGVKTGKFVCVVRGKKYFVVCRKKDGATCVSTAQ